MSLLEESVGALGKEGLGAWNGLQAICLRKLGLSLGEYFSAVQLEEEISKNLSGEGNKRVMRELLDIFCVSKILSDIGEYRKEDYLKHEEAEQLKYRLRDMMAKVVPNVMQLCDIIASPDYILNSSLGMKDRNNLYERYLNDVRSAKDFHSQYPEWRDLFPRPMKERPRL